MSPSQIQISCWPPPTSPGRLVVTRACPGWRSSTSTWVTSSPRAEIAVSRMRIRSVAKRSSASRMKSNSSWTVGTPGASDATAGSRRPSAAIARAARSHSRVSVIAPDCTGRVLAAQSGLDVRRATIYRLTIYRATTQRSRSLTREIPEFGRFAEPSLYILLSLSDGPKHGYAIMTDVEAISGSPLGPGTLYAALARLEQRGMIEALEPVERRRPYRLTKVGCDHPARPARRDARVHPSRPCRRLGRSSG